MNHKKSMFILFCLFLAAALIIPEPVFAQLQNRERVRENIHTLRLLRMTQVLDLTEEQTARIYPFANRIERDKMDAGRKLGEEIRALRVILKDAPEKEQEILARVQNIQTLRSQVKGKDEEFEKFLMENLTSVQKAKYLLFSVDFFRGLGEKLDRARNVLSKPPVREKKNT